MIMMTIGPKGKTVQTLIETYGLVNINLEDSGSIQVLCSLPPSLASSTTS